jgi:transposase-like protein
MGSRRRQHTPQFKAKVALEAAKGNKTTAQLAELYGVHPTQITKWKGQLTTGAVGLFTDRRKKPDRDTEAVEAELYQQIGRLKVELALILHKFKAGVCQ